MPEIPPGGLPPVKKREGDKIVPSQPGFPPFAPGGTTFVPDRERGETEPTPIPLPRREGDDDNST